MNDPVSLQMTSGQLPGHTLLCFASWVSSGYLSEGEVASTTPSIHFQAVKQEYAGRSL